MEQLGDNDPFVMAMKESGILADQTNQHLDTIKEGDGEHIYYNNSLGELNNPHCCQDTKRYQGGRDRDKA